MPTLHDHRAPPPKAGSARPGEEPVRRDEEHIAGSAWNAFALGPNAAAPTTLRRSPQQGGSRRPPPFGLHAPPAAAGALQVGATNDPAEREADQAAEEVLRPGTPQVGPGAAELTPASAEGDRIQRSPAGVVTPAGVGGPAAARASTFGHHGVEPAGARHDAGQRLTAPVRGFFEPRFGHDFGGVRVHAGERAAAAAHALHANAYAAGDDLVFGRGQYAPDSSAGKRLLAHELAHVVQQRNGGAAVIRRDDTAVGPVCEPHIGTFVLDPALADIHTPPSMTTHVRVQAAAATGTATMAERYVELERPVLSAQRIEVFAVPRADVYLTALETAGPLAPEERSGPLPFWLPGDEAFTVNGAVTVVETVGDAVLTTAPSPQTGAAGAVVLLETDAGWVLLDAGMQLAQPQLAAAVGERIRDRVIDALGEAIIGEAILARGPPSGHVLPWIAARVRIGALRATTDQYDNGGIGAALEAQASYRSWYENALRERLNAGRADWERTQAIAPNDSIREQRWQAHLAEEMARGQQGAPPPALRVADESAGVLQMRDDVGAPAAPATAGGVPDLSDTEWVADEEDTPVFAYGAGKIAAFSSRGMFLRPAAETAPAAVEPAARAVSGLRSPTPLGPAAAVPRPVTPWMALSAVGKEGLLLVRLRQGSAFLVDAGGRPRAIAMSSLVSMQTQLGMPSIDGILVTHPHTDHIRHLIELIKAHNVQAANLVASTAWSEASPILAGLRSSTDPDLLRLGYGPNWRPQIAVAGQGVLHLRAGAVDIYARADAHQRLAASITARRSGGPAVASEAVDSASFLYIYGNESSSSRSAVFGDFRGDDVVEMHRSLGAQGFADALRNVRVISGLGHHLSQTAGRTGADVTGLNLLIEHTLLRNGELTILVQSSENFAFGGGATRAGAEGALLDYLVRQGARVVFAGSAGGGTGGTGVIDSSQGVTTQGSGVQVFGTADPRVVEMYSRLELLREAHRTVVENAEFGPTALDLPARPATTLQAELQTDIQRLEALVREFRGHAAADLLDARAPNPGGRDHTSVADRQAFRSASTTPGRTVEQIMADMAVRGPAELALTEAVRGRLRMALASGRSVVLAVEFGQTPRGVVEAIEQLPAPERQAVAQKYRELSELTASLEGDLVPDAQRLEVLARATELRNELRRLVGNTGAEHRATLDAELLRLDSVVERLQAETESETVTGRDLEGRRTRTEYIRMRQAEAVSASFHLLGRGMGALMVVHSIEELGTAAAHLAAGDATIPESVLRVAHSAYGMSIGVRLARTTLSQAALATNPNRVAPWEFAIMAVLEIGAAATASHASAEEHNAAVAGAAVHSSVNLLCMYAGQAIMAAGARVPHPLGRLAVMGVGMAVMTAGERILAFFGADEAVQRWTSFPPGSVTHVHQRIGAVLDEYRILIGTRQLAGRSDAELSGLGVRDTGDLRSRAGSTGDEHAGAVREKENELTGLFEEAYGESRGAWVGLQMLDQQAAQFTQLRQSAMTGREDPNREALDARWRQMDQRLRLSGADPASVASMSQWSELDEKLAEVDTLLGAADADRDYADIFQALDRVQMMMENARYRIDSNSRGGLRPGAMIAPDSPVHDAYVAALRQREQVLAGHQARLVRIGGGSVPVAAAGTEIDPRTAHARLRAVRESYDASVEAARTALPELALPATWADPALLARSVETANRAHPELFNRLRITEMALQSTAAQATGALSLAPSMPPGFIGPPSPTQTPEALQRLIRADVTAAHRAIEDRRVQHGLVFPNELDAVLEQRGAAEDQIFAAQLDAAFPAAGTPAGAARTTPFSDEEIAALHSGDLAAVGGRLTSTEHQLGAFRRIMAPVRSTDGSTLDYERMDRVVSRQYARLGNPYYDYDDGYIYDSVVEHTYDASLHPIVAVIPGGRIGATDNSFTARPLYYQRVTAINGDAVTVIGTGQPDIRITDLHVVPYDEILRLARGSTP